MTQQVRQLPTEKQNREKPIKNLILNALLKNNAILSAGMVIAPVVVFANTFRNALALTVAFTVITFFTLLFSSFVPQSIVYTIRIILYTIIGALVYVPASITLNSFMPDQINAMGIFFPLMITNSFIVSRSETIFFNETKGRMIVDIIFSILGYDIAVLIFGFVREIISTGELNGNMLAMSVHFSAFSLVSGGFILLGIFAALLRAGMLLARKLN